MASFNGVSAARWSISQLRTNSGLFFRIALPWVGAHLVFAMAGFLIFWAGLQGPATFGEAILAYEFGDNLRQQNLATTLPDLVGGVAIDVLWIRFLILGLGAPRSWFALPLGSGRFFARQILLGLIFLASLIPGLVFMGLIGDRFPPLSNYIAVTVMGVTVLAACILCVRLLLILPAAVIDNRALTLTQSYRMTRGLWPGLATALLGVLLAVFIVMALVLLPIAYLSGLLTESPYLAATPFVLREALVSLGLFALGPLLWGVVALAFQTATTSDRAGSSNERGGIAAAP
jgi:hypothetical protein